MFAQVKGWLSAVTHVLTIWGTAHSWFMNLSLAAAFWKAHKTILTLGYYFRVFLVELGLSWTLVNKAGWLRLFVNPCGGICCCHFSRKLCFLKLSSLRIVAPYPSNECVNNFLFQRCYLGNILMIFGSYFTSLSFLCSSPFLFRSPE